MAGKPIHGMTGTPEHRSWQQAKSRCSNPNNPRWRDYGGRGITMCARWRDSFMAFREDMGPRPKGTSLERVNNNGNYEPSNCIWATPKQQQNNMRSNVFVEYRGQRLTVAQWEQETGIDRGTIRARKRRGWTIEEVFNPDVTKTRKRDLPKRQYPKCDVDDCERDAAGHGTLCKRHRQARHRGARLVAGLQYGRSKLVPEVIPDLRAAVRAGERTAVTAVRFGVSKATVRDIARGKTWKDIGT